MNEKKSVDTVLPGGAVPLVSGGSVHASKACSGSESNTIESTDKTTSGSDSPTTGSEPAANLKTKLWRHPTGGKPRSIVILGLGPTANDWHVGNCNYDPPFPQHDEVWTVNKGFRSQDADLVFIMDDLEGERRRSKRYAQDVNDCAVPIITSIIDSDVREHYPRLYGFEYPIYNVIDFWGMIFLARRAARSQGGIAIGKQQFATADAAEVRKAGMRVAGYMRNSIPLMLAYAGFIGVENIQLYGVDYDFPGMAAHEADKPNCEFWVGQLQMGLGIEFYFSSRTTLLSTNKGRDIYGYGVRQPFLNPDWDTK